MTDVSSKVLEVVRKWADPSLFSEQSPLHSVLTPDQVINVILDLEDYYGVAVEDADLAKLTTVSELQNFIENLVDESI